mmetsp:Transcript_20635/g.55695  ORF Transcript_20635/g.55695 Transcript_20635/m.55695 type:complete len:214 (-) Transcript_20635:831-1472(-)
MLSLMSSRSRACLGVRPTHFCARGWARCPFRRPRARRRPRPRRCRPRLRARRPTACASFSLRCRQMPSQKKCLQSSMCSGMASHPPLWTLARSTSRARWEFRPWRTTAGRTVATTTSGLSKTRGATALGAMGTTSSLWGASRSHPVPTLVCRRRNSSPSPSAPRRRPHPLLPTTYLRSRSKSRPILSRRRCRGPWKGDYPSRSSRTAAGSGSK